MPKFDILLSRPSRQYQNIEGIEAASLAEAKRKAVRASRLLDQMGCDATFEDLELAEPCDISEWADYPDHMAKLRVERAIPAKPMRSR